MSQPHSPSPDELFTKIADQILMTLIQAMHPASRHNSGGPATVPNDGSMRTGEDQSRSLSVIGTLGR